MTRASSGSVVVNWAPDAVLRGLATTVRCATPVCQSICPDILTFNHENVGLRLLCGEPGGGDGAFDQSAEAFTGVFINDRRDRIGRPSSVTS